MSETASRHFGHRNTDRCNKRSKDERCRITNSSCAMLIDLNTVDMRQINFIIEKKRDGYALTKEEIDFVIQGYTNGEIPDYQKFAMSMAIFLLYMNADESIHFKI